MALACYLSAGSNLYGNELKPACSAVWVCFLTRQVEECVEDVEAVCVSTLNEFVGVHVSDIRSVYSEDRNNKSNQGT